MQINARICKATIWVFVRNGLTQVMSFVTFMVLARLLSIDDFGKVAAVYIFTELASHISGFGFADALVQKYKYTDKQFWSACWFILMISALITSVLFFGAQVWHAFLPLEDQLESIPRLLGFASIVLLFSPLSNCFEARYRKTLNIKVITIIQISSILVASIIGISMAFGGYGVWSLIAQKIAMELIRLMLYLFKQIHSLQFSFSFSFIKNLSYFGVPLVGTKLVQELTNKGAHAALACFYDTFLLGIYSTGGKFLAIINQLFGSIGGQVLFPLFTEQQFNQSKLEDALLKTMNLALFASILLFCGLSLFADPLVYLLFGEKWQASGKIFAILSLAGISSFQVKILNSYLKATGLTVLQLKISIISLVINILLLFIFLPYGIEKIAYSQTLKSFLIVALIICLIGHITKTVLRPVLNLYFKHLYGSICLLSVIVINLNEGALKASLNLEILFSLGVSLYVIILLIADRHFAKLLKQLIHRFLA